MTLMDLLGRNTCIYIIYWLVRWRWQILTFVKRPIGCCRKPWMSSGRAFENIAHLCSRWTTLASIAWTWRYGTRIEWWIQRQPVQLSTIWDERDNQVTSKTIPTVRKKCLTVVVQHVGIGLSQDRTIIHREKLVITWWDVEIREI